jgi:hypothetical protein
MGDIGLFLPGEEINNCPFIILSDPLMNSSGLAAMIMFNPDTYDPLNNIFELLEGR